jgi:hypothetical protein
MMFRWRFIEAGDQLISICFVTTATAPPDVICHLCGLIERDRGRLKYWPSIFMSLRTQRPQEIVQRRLVLFQISARHAFSNGFTPEIPPHVWIVVIAIVCRERCGHIEGVDRLRHSLKSFHGYFGWQELAYEAQ